MLGTSLLRNGDVAEARVHVAHAIRHFYAAGDASGLTLTLDDMSAVAVADGDLPRAARLRGAARNLTTETGAELADFVEDTFETGVRPGVRTQMSADDLARYGAEGAAWTLDEAVAYALEGADPADPRRRRGVGWPGDGRDRSISRSCRSSWSTTAEPVTARPQPRQRTPGC